MHFDVGKKYHHQREALAVPWVASCRARCPKSCVGCRRHAHSGPKRLRGPHFIGCTRGSPQVTSPARQVAQRDGKIYAGSRSFQREAPHLVSCGVALGSGPPAPEPATASAGPSQPASCVARDALAVVSRRARNRRHRHGEHDSHGGHVAPAAGASP